ncbi:Protochlorophyllide-dependent translocon component 52, chloroplastic [Linum perenne]
MRAISSNISASLSSLPIRRSSLVNGGTHPFKRSIHFPSSPIPISSFPPKLIQASSRFNLFTSFVSSKPLDQPDEVNSDEKFDWYAQWYPVMPVCDLDKKVPHGKKVMGIDVVVWWDCNENAWKVFDDMCPHRLAPLSEGRIDQWGRLQCVYHGWCFDGSGSCKLIPQSPPDGPPVHTNKRACVATYPTIVHHNIVWFWPNSDPQYKDISETKKPPFIPELEDPSFTTMYGVRDLPYGYEVLVENLMDVAHLPYAHYGLVESQPLEGNRDKEGGRPLDIIVKELELQGFDAELGYGNSRFDAPCIFTIHIEVPSATNKVNNFASLLGSMPSKRIGVIVICTPVSPGNSRFIWAFSRNFIIWVDKVLPRWMFHTGTNLVLDSDLYLLHVEERKIKEFGTENWQKSCFVPTKTDAIVVGFRRWINKYAGGGVDWRGKYSGDLPPTAPKEQLMDRYWSHVVNCSSCNSAYKGLNALEIILQVASVGLIGVVAATNHGTLSMVARTGLGILAITCFAASRWLAFFVYNNFHYHGYDHALPEKIMFLVRRLGPSV